MSISLHQLSVPVVVQMLSGLSGVIDKAAAYVAEKKVDPQALLTARFAPDMYDFAKQVRVCSTWGVSITARLAGVEPPKFPDDEKTFDDLKARVAKAIQFAKAQDAAAIDAVADKVISFPAGANIRKFKGKDFLMHFALPHLFFHCTTAYDLIRHAGVPLAKRDFMGPVQGVIEG
jgi:hypothetical protein